MTPKQLTTTRYIVTAPWPGCEFEPGNILTRKMDGWYFGVNRRAEIKGFAEWEIEKCTANFRRLQWWEFRELSELPEYLKWGNNVVKITEWCRESGKYYGFKYVAPSLKDGKLYSADVFGFTLHMFPATLEEYNEYLSRIKPQDNE
jgi:hypothetical protein